MLVILMKNINSEEPCFCIMVQERRENLQKTENANWEDTVLTLIGFKVMHWLQRL